MQFSIIQLRAKGLLILAITTLTATIAGSAAFLPVPSTASQVLAQSVSEQKAEADQLLQQGIKQYQLSQFEAALQSWEQALIIYRQIKDRKGEGQSLGNLGLAYSALGEYTKAIKYHEQSLAIARELNDRKGEGMALGNLGIAYSALGQYTKAIDYQQQRLAITREINDRRGEGQSLGNLGIAYDALADYIKAIEYLQESLTISRQINDRRGEGQSLGNLGNAYYALGDYTKAINYHQQRLAIARQIDDKLGERKALGNLGNSYSALGEYTKAIDYQQQSLIIARQIQDRQGEGQSLGNLGNIYSALGDYTKAIDYQQQSLTIARQIQDRRGEGKALGNLGNIYSALGDYTKASDYQQERLAIARQIQDKRGEEAGLGNLGNIYSALGDYTKAIDYHEQSLTIARQIQDRRGEGQSLSNLGIACYGLGDYIKAIDYQQQSLTIARKIQDRRGEGQSLGNLGIAYYVLGDYIKAIDYHQQRLAIARKIQDEDSEGKALGNLGIAYDATGDYTKAIDYHQQSLAIARKINDSESEGTALNNLGVAFKNLGDLTAAEKNLREGIAVWKSLRAVLGNKDEFKISVFEEQARTYRTLQQVLIAQNKTDAALEISEAGRARAFVDLLSRTISPNANTPLTAYNPTLAQIKAVVKTQNATLVQYSIIYNDFKVGNKQQVQESQLYIWAIKPNGEINFRTVDLKPLWQKQNTSLTELVNNTRVSIGVGDRAIFDTEFQNPVNPEKLSSNLKQLHELLIKPIADLLPTDSNQRVIFVPQNELFLVPFAALQDAQGNYLIEKHTILTAPSIQVLELTHQQQQRVGKLPTTFGQTDALVVGNPTMPSVAINGGEKKQQLASLPGAKREAEAIAPLLRTKALTGNTATKANIIARLPQAKIVHLATHGLFDSFQGLQSSIALAPEGQDQGLLTAEEILKLKLNANLVVLSACNTGRGKITGDGVIGLSRSLFIAGTPSVIASLWSVPDAPTAELMTEFYTNLNQKKLNKAQSLRQAMLTIMEKNRNNPKAWAAFTLLGEAE
ncbi:MAG TPA: tetratricopeptide repeat protein [Oculatellaceae cyanobacterium]|jgi:CHAT domain-containing protein